MIDKSGLVLCPICHSKTKVKVNKDTVLKNFPLLCPKCKQESTIDFDDRGMVIQIPLIKR